MMLEEDMFASVISILSADGPAPDGVKTSEDTLIILSGSRNYEGSRKYQTF